MNTQSSKLDRIVQKIISFFKLVLCSTIFISPVYGQLIIQQESFSGEENKVTAELEQISDELIKLPLRPNQQQSDAEILRSLDDFDGGLNEGLLLTDDSINEPSAVSEDILIDSVIADDSFEHLNFDDILMDQQSDNEVAPNPSFDLPTSSQLKMKTQGVGVNGIEEALINKLDNSDLMDFDKDLDIWGEEVLDKKELLPSGNHIEPIELDDTIEQMDFNDIELIDEINDIDGAHFDDQ